MIPEKCVSETNDSRISLNDKQSVSAIFLNPGRVPLNMEQDATFLDLTAALSKTRQRATGFSRNPVWAELLSN